MRSKDPSQVCLIRNFPRPALICVPTTRTMRLSDSLTLTCVNYLLFPDARTLLLNFLSLVIIEVAGKWREQALTNARVTRRPSFDLMPDDFVQASGRGGVGNIKTHPRRIQGRSPGRPAQSTQGGVHLKKRLLGFNHGIRPRVGVVLKTRPHVVLNQIEQRKRRQTKDELNRLQKAGLRVEGGVDVAASYMRTDGQGDSAMAIHMIDSVL